jgi:hypothetical protein
MALTRQEPIAEAGRGPGAELWIFATVPAG